VDVRGEWELRDDDDKNDEKKDAVDEFARDVIVDVIAVKGTLDINEDIRDVVLEEREVEEFKFVEKAARWYNITSVSASRMKSMWCIINSGGERANKCDRP
jgi:hypothetical protein